MFGRMSGGGTPDTFRLGFQDVASGVHFLSIDISPGDLMCALTGRGTECEMEVRWLELIGLKSEHKTELVQFDQFAKGLRQERKGRDDVDRSPTVDKALAPFEVDGWVGSSSDLFNGHNRDHKKGAQRVRFYRYVDPTTGKPVMIK
jgi:hypothetical protein